MTRQRLYRQVTANVDAKGHVALTFEQVPQGSAWTGSVSLYASPVFGGVPASLTNGVLQGAQWWLLRNQSPILQMAGAATAVDVQCVGQETLSITGYGLASGDSITAVWSGWSDDLADAAWVEPHPTGVTPAYVQVYNTEGSNGPLQVTEVPDPLRTITVATGFTATAGTTTAMFTPGIGASGVEILALTLQVATAQSGTTAQAVPFLATIRLNDGANITPLLAVETIITQTSNQNPGICQPMFQMPMVSNQTLELNVGALAAGNVLRVNASAVLSYVPHAP